MKRIVCPDQDSWIHTGIQLLCSHAEKAMKARGRFRLALSGGKTPEPLFQSLATSESALSIDWSLTDVFWSDERCVPPEHPDSNFGNAWREALSLLPIPSNNIHRVSGEKPPTHAADEYEHLLRKQLGRHGALDLVLLGVGTDGHTASLFPGSPALEEANRWAVAVAAPAVPHWRVTMTFPILNSARSVIILARGRDKREIMNRIQTDELVPIHRVAPSSGDVTWLLDREAVVENPTSYMR